MTCIVKQKSKRLLKAEIIAGKNIQIKDPSRVNPRVFMSNDIKENERVVVTNHPRRSYFATIKRIEGKVVVA